MLLRERAKQEALRLRREASAAFWYDFAVAVNPASAAWLRRARAVFAPSQPTRKAAPCQP
jgi:hypothetical protein